MKVFVIELRRLGLALSGVVLATGLFGCGAGDEPAAGPEGAEQVSVVATTGMIGDIASRIAGDRARVETIMKPGVDPHLYNPTRSDVARLMNADLILYNGLKLEGKMQDTFERLQANGKAVVAVASQLDEARLLAPAGAGGHPDPHVWMDVEAWSAVSVFIRDTLVGEFPEAGEDFRRNAEGLLEEMDLLEDYVSTVIDSIPERRRLLVTAHDAFNYFGRAYGIEVRGIQGLSTESEAGIRDINELIDVMVEREVSAVFVETSVADKNVKSVVEGARSRGHEVVVGGSLYSDAMGQTGAYEGTYVGMIDHNATTIATSLGGDAPEGGFREWKSKQ